MLYDVRLVLRYSYDVPVSGGRHLVRVVPRTLPGIQRVLATSVSFDPHPSEVGRFTDFFGNPVTILAMRSAHRSFAVAMTARVDVERQPGIDLSPPLALLPGEIAGVWTLDADAPHHYTGASPRVPLDEAITAYARARIDPGATVREAARMLCHAIHADFAYDSEATLVDTSVAEAFALRRGVCQDFSHIMIAGLRGLGIPAGYVSGYLRTLPPPGGERLEGADAMHAWVRVWCGREAGWIEFDPTNAMLAGQDHIVVGYGRDYAEVTPIVGILRSSGGQRASQAVDVIAVA